MSYDIVGAVKKMHNQFGINKEFNVNEKRFRMVCMLEELAEYGEAHTKEDELDALVDLVVFAVGTAERAGFGDVFDLACSRVMRANMQKKVSPLLKRGGFEFDLVKPKGWKSPNFSDLV